MARYGSSPAELMVRLSPDVQRYALRLTPQQALELRSSTLAEIAQVYGEDTVALLISAWLEELCRFCRTNPDMMLTENQLRQAAELMYAEAACLNVAELSLFFVGVKRGDYGKFYGAVDAQSILCFLQEYKRERSAAMQQRRRRYEQQQRKAEYEAMMKIKPLSEEIIAEIRKERETI